VRDSENVESARRELGEKLAAYRRAAGYSQAEFARLVTWSRSSVANVETGRQHVPREFWKLADAALRADGVLLTANDKIETVVRREREEAVRRARPLLIAVAKDNGTGTTGELVQWTRWAPGQSGIGDGLPDVIALAASDARGHAEKLAVTEIGPGMAEQLKADVVRLGRAYVSAPPLPLFAAMYRSLGHLQAALGQKAYPAQVRELSFLAGVLCGLMANASLDLGRENAADDLARAAWTYGRTIDHSPLMGWARGTQALAAIWEHRYPDAAQYAQDGLTHLPAGMGAARLHAIHARALSAHGDQAQARAALKAAANARADTYRDELHDGVAGEFAFDDAKLWYYHALTYVDAGNPAKAEGAAAAAIRLYQAAPVRLRSYGCEALALVHLAIAQLMSNKLDDAAETLGSMLVLEPERRISSLNQHVETCRGLLRGAAYRDARTARRLEEQLAQFSGASAARALPSGR